MSNAPLFRRAIQTASGSSFDITLCVMCSLQSVSQFPAMEKKVFRTVHFAERKETDGVMPFFFFLNYSCYNVTDNRNICETS